MTNTPAPSTAPIPTAPLDLTQNAAQVTGAALEKTEYSGVLTVGSRSFNLVSKLSALDMVILQEAHESGMFRSIIEAVPRLVVKTERDALQEYLLSDPDDDADRVSLDDVMGALNDGLEQLNARPTDR